MGWMLGTDTHHARSESERWAGQFHILKATEGATFIDPEFKKMLNGWQENNFYPWPIGVYHFLSEKSGIREQIYFFLETIQYVKGKAMLILDYEGEFAKKDTDGLQLRTAIDLMDYFTGGAQVVIYMDKSNAKKISEKTSIPSIENVCLWLADYKGDYKLNWTPIMRQVCTSPCDIDVFYGSEMSWDSIARSWK